MSARSICAPKALMSCYGSSESWSCNASTSPVYSTQSSAHRRNRYGNTPLWTALCNVRDSEGAIVYLLLESGSDPDAENESAVSPLALASRVANDDLMRFFRP